MQDHCTFQPKLNANSLKIVEEKTGGQHDFVARMESEKAQRERKLKELIKQQAAGDVDPKVAAAREQKRKKQCYAYFKRELGWDTSGGIEEHINKVLDNPESVGLREFLDPAQIRHIRKLRGHEQALCLYDQFCVRDFVKRQVSDMSTRKTGGSDHSSQLREREMTLKAEEYFKDRFKWSKVDAARLNDLLDNANVLELELSEANLVSLRSIKPSQQVRAIYRALQTKAFLQRTMQDIRKREGNMQQMWREHAASMRGLSMHPTSDEAVQNFIDRCACMQESVCSSFLLSSPLLSSCLPSFLISSLSLSWPHIMGSAHCTTDVYLSFGNFSLVFWCNPSCRFLRHNIDFLTNFSPPSPSFSLLLPPPPCLCHLA